MTDQQRPAQAPDFASRGLMRRPRISATVAPCPANQPNGQLYEGEVFYRKSDSDRSRPEEWHLAYFARLEAAAGQRRLRGHAGIVAPPATEEIRPDVAIRQLEALVRAELLRSGFSVLHIGCGDGQLLAAILDRFPEAECYGVNWPAPEPAVQPSSPPPGIQLYRIYIDQLFQSPPHHKRGKFDVVLMTGRFTLPEGLDSSLLPQQADGWLEKYVRFVIGVGSTALIRELKERGMNVLSLESASDEGQAIYCTGSSPFVGQPRSWADRVETFLSFPRWFAQNLSRHGIADAVYYACHVAWAVLEGRLRWAVLADQELRTRFCATLTPTRSIRADTVYVFVFLGEFGYELLNWQGVVRKFAQCLPPSSRIVVGGRKGLQPFYETAAQYIEIDDVPQYRDSFAAAYFGMTPQESRRHRPPTREQFEHDLRLRRAIEEHIRRTLKIRGQRVEYIFSSQLNALEDCVFGVDPRFYGIPGYHGAIYASLNLANNAYSKIQADTRTKSRIEAKLGFALEEPYVLIQSRRRVVGPQSAGELDARPLVEEFARHYRVVYLLFSTGRYLDSGSRASLDAVTTYEAASFLEQSCLIAHARHCVFLTEGDLGSHTYLPPLLGKDVVVVTSRNVFSRRSAPVDFWNRNVFRLGGQMIPWPSETLDSSEEIRRAAARLISKPPPGALTPDAAMAPPTKRILFIMRHEGYVRNCDHVIAQLAEKGHSIHVAIGIPSRKAHDAKVLSGLTERWPSITYSRLPILSIRPWDDLTGLSRVLIDYLRYLEPTYDNAPCLRARSTRRVPRAGLWVFEHVSMARHRLVLAAVNAVLRLVDHLAPSHLECEQYLTTMRPDLVAFTPLLDYDSDSLDYLKSATAMGIPTALCVASWDNLSNKGLVQLMPDKIILWNDTQKTEAVRMHRIPPERVVVTGAHLFDHWFAMRPRCSREEFCDRRGLDPARPFLLYVCSSGFIAENEVPFVRRWIEKVRGAGSPLRTMGILVRPHGGNPSQWRNADLSEYANVTVWPPLGEGPVDEQSKQNYFDSLYHSAGIVGINTSALIEGGIVGKHVFTILAEEFRETQVGTVHFHYLVQGGLLTTAANLEEHVDQLYRVLINGDEERDKARDAFVRDFIRPNGLETPCSPLAVKALEDLMSGRRASGRQKVGLGVAAARPVAALIAAIVHAYIAQERNLAMVPKRPEPGIGLIHRHRARSVLSTQKVSWKQQRRMLKDQLLAKHRTEASALNEERRRQKKASREERIRNRRDEQQRLTKESKKVRDALVLDERTARALERRRLRKANAGAGGGPTDLPK